MRCRVIPWLHHDETADQESFGEYKAIGPFTARRTSAWPDPPQALAGADHQDRRSRRDRHRLRSGDVLQQHPVRDLVIEIRCAGQRHLYSDGAGRRVVVEVGRIRRCRVEVECVQVCPQDVGDVRGTDRAPEEPNPAPTIETEVGGDFGVQPPLLPVGGGVARRVRRVAVLRRAEPLIRNDVRRVVDVAWLRTTDSRPASGPGSRSGLHCGCSTSTGQQCPRTSGRTSQ